MDKKMLSMQRGGAVVKGIIDGGKEAQKNSEENDF
jgi:hypothetical protein